MSSLIVFAIIDAAAMDALTDSPLIIDFWTISVQFGRVTASISSISGVITRS